MYIHYTYILIAPMRRKIEWETTVDLWLAVVRVINKWDQVQNAVSFDLTIENFDLNSLIVGKRLRQTYVKMKVSREQGATLSGNKKYKTLSWEGRKEATPRSVRCTCFSFLKLHQITFYTKAPTHQLNPPIPASPSSPSS